ncbi:fibronectin type III domain-containing protein, partial [Nitrosococcus oceani]|uniref:fibronectin type III domain-containing protein n=1 Tax=Nitrosococcus oceani TaxID=1229 RepID=UPI0034D1F0B0
MYVLPVVRFGIVYFVTLLVVSSTERKLPFITCSILYPLTTLTQVLTVPGSPTLSATAASATSVSLSWTAPANDGGSAITGYKIEYANATSPYKVLVSNTGNSQT